MFLAALLVTCPNWKQSKYPSTGECINKLWCNLTMKYYIATRRNELHTHNNTDESKVNMMNERSQIRKSIYKIRFVYNSRKPRLIYRDNKQIVIAWEWGQEKVCKRS